jgi:hypothetical protein
VTLFAVADSCFGDEGFPESCRVPEIDETNNVSEGLPLANLPTKVD